MFSFYFFGYIFCKDKLTAERMKINEKNRFNRGVFAQGILES